MPYSSMALNLPIKPSWRTTTTKGTIPQAFGLPYQGAHIHRYQGAHIHKPTPAGAAMYNKSTIAQGSGFGAEFPERS